MNKIIFITNSLTKRRHVAEFHGKGRLGMLSSLVFLGCLEFLKNLPTWKF
jgi:hypothetical protein